MIEFMEAFANMARVKHVVSKIGSGKTPAGGSEAYPEEGVVFLRSQNIHFGGLRLEDVAYISEETHREMENTRLVEGDVLLNITGASIGRVARFPKGIGEANVNQHVCILRPTGSVDSRFLEYALSAYTTWAQILSLQAGGNRDGLNFEQVGDLRIPTPAIDTQRRIADFLDAETVRIDELVAKRRQMRDLLILKRARIVENVLGLDNIQRRNNFVPLKYLVESVTVGIVITPAKWYVDIGGVPALRGLNIQAGAIDASDLVYISRAGHLENQKSRLHSGDVVVVRTGQAGTAAVVPPELDGANCIDLILVRPGEKVSPQYLQYVLNSDYAKNHISEHSVGSIQAHFNISSMKQIPIPEMSRAEQQRVTDILDGLTAQIDSLYAKLTKQEALLSEHRQALITAAVTGQFDVSLASGRGVEE